MRTDTVQEFLGGPHAVNSGWRFDFGEHLASAWGGTYGGALAAGCVALARRAAPGRSPRSLHMQLMRKVPLGVVSAHVRQLYAGRTVTTVQVQVLDGRDRVAVQSEVTLVDTQALARQETYVTAPAIRVVAEPRSDRHPNVASPVARVLGLKPMDWLRTPDLPPAITGNDSYVGVGRAPWSDQTRTGPELACVMADVCNGGAIVHGLPPGAEYRYAFPNTDLSLRFSALPGAAEVTGVGTLLCVHEGTTIVGIRVQTEAGQLAHGLSGSILAPLAASPS